MTGDSLHAVAFDASGQGWQLEVRPASSLTLSAHFPPGGAPRVGTIFTRLAVTWQGKPVLLSRCRLDPGPSPEALPVLVFTDEVLDCRGLFEDGRVKNLLGVLNELPLVLAQRQQVKEEFRSFVADVIYDLTVYKKFLDEQDRAFAQEDPEVAAAAQQVLLARVGPNFFRSMDRIVERLGELVRTFTPEEHERHGYYFRQQVWNFLMGAEFMRRTNLKPRGYPGDAVMMQMIYDDAYEGAWVFNKLLHKHPVQHAAAQAVRNRRVLVPQLLHQRLAQWRDGVFRVLSVACGPARELEEVYRDVRDPTALEVTLLDQDPEALAAAKRTVAAIEGRRGDRLLTNTVNTSVRMILRERELVGRMGQFAFIYSMGMFDYLTPPVARAVLAKLYELLAPGGVALIGNYHVANASRFYMAYWLDWSLYYRTEDELLGLAAGLPGAKLSLQLDDTKCQMFLTVEKT